MHLIAIVYSDEFALKKANNITLNDKSQQYLLKDAAKKKVNSFFHSISMLFTVGCLPLENLFDFWSKNMLYQYHARQSMSRHHQENTYHLALLLAQKVYYVSDGTFPGKKLD